MGQGGQESHELKGDDGDPSEVGVADDVVRSNWLREEGLGRDCNREKEPSWRDQVGTFVSVRAVGDEFGKQEGLKQGAWGKRKGAEVRGEDRKSKTWNAHRGEGSLNWKKNSKGGCSETI